MLSSSRGSVDLVWVNGENFATGKQADLVVLRADLLNMQPVHDPVSSVVFQASLANIDSVMVAGRWRKRAGGTARASASPPASNSAPLRRNPALAREAVIGQHLLDRSRGRRNVPGQQEEAAGDDQAGEDDERDEERASA